MQFAYESKPVVDDVSFELAKGEKLVLLGSNGSGKSTILRLLAGLYFLKDGEIFLEDTKLTKKSVNKDFRKRVGILFQNPESMIFNPTVYDEIAFSLNEFAMNDVKQRVHDIAQKFEIEHLLEKNPLYLSGGEKQKVILAAILVYEPDVIFLDEPTAAMDPKTTGWFIDLVISMNKSVVIATHDISLAYEIGDRAVVLDENHKKVYDGTLEALMQNLDVLVQANLIHKHKHKHKSFAHSHYHLHNISN
jgi:cobalt/nickel transport system ATP-binding protein